jgi:hypothetical protein
MSQAAINTRTENTNMFSDLYKVMDRPVDGFEHSEVSSKYFGYNLRPDSESVGNWEFFCNELEYE